jgi:hypothetical protein
MWAGKLMKTLVKPAVFSMILVFFLPGAGARAGEAGQVRCSTPGCGYQTDLSIGGGRKSPAVTGYCAKERKFVSVKLMRWADYRQPQMCPGGKEPLQPVYGGADVSKIPCPKCGRLTLKYQRRLMFD